MLGWSRNYARFYPWRHRFDRGPHPNYRNLATRREQGDIVMTELAENEATEKFRWAKRRALGKASYPQILLYLP